jgi:hypothetical protein
VKEEAPGGRLGVDAVGDALEVHLLGLIEYANALFQDMIEYVAERAGWRTCKQRRVTSR